MKTPNLDHTQKHDERLAVVVDHIRRVLVKFPRNTVPADLTWALDHYAASSGRFSRLSHDQKWIRLAVTEPFTDRMTRVSIPSKLLDAAEQDIHSWTRKTYWAGRRREQAAKAQQAAFQLERLRTSADRAQAAYEQALAESRVLR